MKNLLTITLLFSFLLCSAQQKKNVGIELFYGNHVNYNLGSFKDEAGVVQVDIKPSKTNQVGIIFNWNEKSKHQILSKMAYYENGRNIERIEFVDSGTPVHFEARNITFKYYRFGIGYSTGYKTEKRLNIEHPFFLNINIRNEFSSFYFRTPHRLTFSLNISPGISYKVTKALNITLSSTMDVGLHNYNQTRFKSTYVPLSTGFLLKAGYDLQLL